MDIISLTNSINQLYPTRATTARKKGKKAVNKIHGLPVAEKGADEAATPEAAVAGELFRQIADASLQAPARTVKALPPLVAIEKQRQAILNDPELALILQGTEIEELTYAGDGQWTLVTAHMKLAISADPIPLPPGILGPCDYAIDFEVIEYKPFRDFNDQKEQLLGLLAQLAEQGLIDGQIQEIRREINGWEIWTDSHIITSCGDNIQIELQEEESFMTLVRSQIVSPFSINDYYDISSLLQDPQFAATVQDGIIRGLSHWGNTIFVSVVYMEAQEEQLYEIGITRQANEAGTYDVSFTRPERFVSGVY